MHRVPKVIRLSFFAVLMVLQADSTSVAEAPHPLEPSDTSSPRATLTSFIDSCNEFHNLVKTGAQTDGVTSQFLAATERILDCLDLSELPNELRDSIGVESAVYLKEVLDRIELLLCLGQPPTAACTAQDLNLDGAVNVQDLIDLLLEYGQDCP